MNKFFEVVLKTIIVISFICIVVFVGVAVINNQAIAFESYNYIVSTRDRTNFKSTLEGINSNVRKGYAKSLDVYAQYLSKAVNELNGGIDYFTDYLSQESKLTKGEHDKLIHDYKEYAKAFREVEKAYSEYLITYAEAVNTGTDYVKDTVNAKSIYVCTTLIKSFKAGSSLFKDLSAIADNYIVPQISFQTYRAQSYMIKVGLVDYSLDYANKALMEKLRNEDYTGYDTDKDYNSKLFLYYLNTCNNYSDKDFLTNESFRNFTINLNSLDIFEWAGNYNNYYNTLSKSLKEKAGAANSYFNSTYGFTRV